MSGFSGALALGQPGFTPRGALVKRAADATGQNVTGGVTAITFGASDTEVYDTDNLHSTSVNTSRMTIPTGWTWARVAGMVYVNNVTINVNFLQTAVYKNGAAFNGYPIDLRTSGSVTMLTNVCSAPVPVVAGDYFELMWFINTDTSVDLMTGTWFAVELLG